MHIYDKLKSWDINTDLSVATNLAKIKDKISHGELKMDDLIFDDMTPLIYFGRTLTTPVEFLEYCVEKGADINHQNRFGDTILHKCCDAGIQYEKIKYLLDNGADYTIKNINGRQPHHLMKIFKYSSAEEKERGEELFKEKAREKGVEEWEQMIKDLEKDNE